MWNVCCKLGNRELIRFWADKWLGDKPFEMDFPELFETALRQDVCIADCGTWSDINWQWKLSWSSPLDVLCNTQLEELLKNLAEISPIKDTKDKWFCCLNKTEGFTVKSYYTTALLNAQEQEPLAENIKHALNEEVWRTKAPSKLLSFFFWRLFCCDCLSGRN